MSPSTTITSEVLPTRAPDNKRVGFALEQQQYVGCSRFASSQQQQPDPCTAPPPNGNGSLLAASLASQRTLSGHLHGCHLPCTLRTQTSQSLYTQECSAEEAHGCGAEVGSPGSCPPHGAKAICGKRTAMEDAYAVRPDLLCVPLTQELQQARQILPTRIAQKYKESGVDSCSDLSSISMCSTSSTSSASTSSSASSCTETFHFFGVYDGHGGAQAAHHCADRLHKHLHEALAAVLPSPPAADHAPGPCIPDAGSITLPPLTEDSPMDSCEKVGEWMQRGGAALEEAAPACDDMADAASHGRASPDAATSPSSRCEHPCVSSIFKEAMKAAFIKTDAEFATDECSALVGSTAVVALVGGTKYCIANCGDSRAVLYRGGKAMQLTDDHKPEREDEAERVEKAGGQVLYWNGHRVMGVLAMSRAIGDHMLRPYVIAEPEVTIVSRHVEDELLLLASDGLWDVMTNQEASSLAARCLKRAQERGASRKAAARIAASVLTRAAMDRGSKDNITVVIVDLQVVALPADSAAAAPAASAADSTPEAPAAAAGDAPAAAPTAEGVAAAPSVQPAVQQRQRPADQAVAQPQPCAA